MNDELKIQTSALAEFVCDGNEALQFRLVSQSNLILIFYLLTKLEWNGLDLELIHYSMN